MQVADAGEVAADQGPRELSRPGQDQGVGGPLGGAPGLLAASRISSDAAAALFGITNAAVRQARRKGLVDFVATHAVSNGPPIHLLILSSAMKHWAKGGANYEAALDEMRGNGLTLGKGRAVYNILHVRPLFRVEDALGAADHDQ